MSIGSQISSSRARTELLELKRAAKRIDPPQSWLFTLRIFSAGFGDVVDNIASPTKVLGIATGGIVTAIAFVIDSGIDIIVDTFLLVSEISLDKKRVKLNELHVFIQKNIEVSMNRMQFYSAVAEQTRTDLVNPARQSQQRENLGNLLDGKRLQPGKAKAGQIKSKLGKMSKNKVVMKMGWLRNLVQSGLDFIPVIEMIPWRTFGVYFRDKDFKRNLETVMNDFSLAVQIKMEEIQLADHTKNEVGLMENSTDDMLRLAA